MTRDLRKDLIEFLESAAEREEGQEYCNVFFVANVRALIVRLKQEEADESR